MADLGTVESPTKTAIWSAIEAAQESSHRTYIGASVLGDECSRKLWYSFRWAHDPEHFDGRKLSIFESGHRWESRLVDMLKAAGIDLQEVDPVSGEQWSVRFAGGHGGGHLDGEAVGVPEAPVAVHVVEFKSHNDKSFKALKKDGVQKAKPAHYAQMQTYMHERHRERALYVAVNKNDDDLHVERIRYDAAASMALIAKAERIVTAAQPPARAHEDPTAKMAWLCGYCPAKALCHEGAFANRNCRTCLHATPELDGEGRWTCARHHRDLTKEEQRAGCPSHLFIPGLVPGEQVDADEAAETVTYQITRGDLVGGEWVDGHIAQEIAASSPSPRLAADPLRLQERAAFCTTSCAPMTIALCTITRGLISRSSSPDRTLSTPSRPAGSTS